MRTVKHLIKPVKFNHKNQTLKMMEDNNLTEKQLIQEFLFVIYQYQKGKNYFLQKLNESDWNNKINFNHNSKVYDICKNFRQSEETKKLVEQTDLKARMWKIALDEAFNTKLRTIEATLVKIKKEINQKLFQDFKKDKMSNIEFELLQYLTNSIFFNYSSFHQFKTEVLDKYRFISIFKQKFLPPFLEKVQKNKKLKNFNSFKDFKSFKDFVFTYNLKSYLRYLKKKIKKHISLTNVTDVVGKINPTLKLDADCYTIKFNPQIKKYMLFVMGLNKHGNQRFAFELSGFRGKKSYLNLNTLGNILISYNSTNTQFFVHFHFEHKALKTFKAVNKINAFNNFKIISLKPLNSLNPLEVIKTKVGTIFNPYLYLRKNGLKLQLSGFYQFLIEKFVKENKKQLYESLRFAMGLDHGFNETFTSSHDMEFGQEQKEKLHKEAEIQHKILANTQKSSHDKYHFGIELKNKNHKRRNNQNNFYNHNANLKNINTKCRTTINKSNVRLDQFYHIVCDELLNYCQLNQIQYLCLEDLLIQGGKGKRRKSFNREVNLFNTGKIYELLAQKIKNKDLNIKIILVNPSYTSQMCSQCGYVAKENRKVNTFCCQQCGFGSKIVAEGSKLDDLNASINICNLAMLMEHSEVFSLFLSSKRGDLKTMFLQLSLEYQQYVSKNSVVTSPVNMENIHVYSQNN